MRMTMPRLTADETDYLKRRQAEMLRSDNERIDELEFLASRADLRYLSGQAAWLNYHAAWCRYRELQADVIRQLWEETDPEQFRAREEAVVDGGDLFETLSSV